MNAEERKGLITEQIIQFVSPVALNYKPVQDAVYAAVEKILEAWTVDVDKAFEKGVKVGQTSARLP